MKNDRVCYNWLLCKLITSHTLWELVKTGLSMYFFDEDKLQPRKWERRTSAVSQVSSPDLCVGTS